MFAPKKVQHEYAILEDALIYERERYAFADFQQIDFHWVRTIQKTNFAKVGEANTVTFRITMADGRSKALQIDERTWFHGINRNRKDEIEVLLEVYQKLSGLTLVPRLERYLQDLRTKGYFTYVEERFTPPATVQIGDDVFLVKMSKIL